MTKRGKTRQKELGGAHRLKAQTVIAKAMAGEKTQAIANEVGLSRSAVSQILNSDQVKEKIKEIDQRLASGIDDAIQTILKSVAYDYNAAYDLLKNFGSMKTTVDLRHTFPKPTVIEKADGSKVILGTEEGD